MSATVTGILLTGTHASRPSSGVSAGTLYSCTTHSLVYQTSDTGSTWATWANLAGTGSTTTVATDTIWDAAGDLVQGTGADTAAKLGAGTAGQFLKSGGAATENAWASRELDYVEYTSPVSVTATTEAAADTVVTANSITGDAVMKIMVEFFAPYISTPAANDSIRIVLYDNAGGAGAASIGMLALITNPHATVLMRPSALVQRRLTPTAATHVYSIRSFVGSGTGSIGAGAGGSGNIMPGFIRITRAV